MPFNAQGEHETRAERRARVAAGHSDASAQEKRMRKRLSQCGYVRGERNYWAEAKKALRGYLMFVQ